MQLEKREKLLKEKNDLTNGLMNTDIEAVKTILTTRIQNIDKLLKDLQHEYNSYSDFVGYLLKNEINDSYTIQRNIYSVRNSLIYAPTQVGKTTAMIQLVQDCISHGISVIISCENKKDQMCQFFERLSHVVEKHYTDVFKDCFITTVDNRNFNNIVSEMKEHKTFVLCCLDNFSQIQKTYEKMIGICDHGCLQTLCIIHDEGDVITKSRNINDVVDHQPASHKMWIKCINDYVSSGISVKRVFVTATPENVVYLHKPGYVWNLPIPENYVGSDKLVFNEIDDFSEKHVVKLLAREVQSRQQEGGIILYCVERNKDESVIGDRGTQNSIFSSLVANIEKTGLDAISVYNSNGIKVSLRSKEQRKLFVNRLESMDLKYIIKENKQIVYVKKNEMSISKFYGHLQSIGCKVVLTIGKDLISRGISFVSDSKANPLTATTMIYKPGQTLHQVGICQAIGRLTGTAQPGLHRRLYTTNDVYTNYMTFMNNQKHIINVIVENGNAADSAFNSDITLWKSTRSIDRPVLKLEKDVQFWSEEPNEDDDSRMKELIDMWWNADTIIGNILKVVYDSQNGVSEKYLKHFIKSLGTMSKTWYTDLHTPNKHFVKVFCRDSNRITRLLPKAREYIVSHKL